MQLMKTVLGVIEAANNDYGKVVIRGMSVTKNEKGKIDKWNIFYAI